MPANNLIARAHGRGGRRALSNELEREIYRKVTTKEMTRAEAAGVYEVHRNTVTNIITRLQMEMPATSEQDDGPADKPTGGA